MHTVIRLSFVLSLLGATACQTSATLQTSADYAGAYAFQTGTVEIDCPSAAPVTYDLAHEAMGMPGSFTDTPTGTTMFHHVDINDCMFDFTVDDEVASSSGGSCQVPDGQGGTTTYVVSTLVFEPMGEAHGLWIDGSGTIGGCPMTIVGVAARE